MKIFSSFFILVTVLFWSFNFSILRADTGGDPPVITGVYLVALDYSSFDLIPDYLEVDVGETFLLAGVAIGQIPIYYEWVYPYGRVTGNLFLVSFSEPGEYPVFLMVTDVNGYTDQRNITIVVGGGSPLPNNCQVDILLDGQSLEEAIYDIDSTATLTAEWTGIAPITFTWRIDGEVVSTNDTYEMVLQDRDWKMVFLEATDAEGCRSYDFVRIRGFACEAPPADIYDADFNYVSAITVQAGEPLTLYQVAPPMCGISGKQYYWMIGEEVINESIVLEGFFFTEPGVYILTSVYRDACGCVGRAPVEVTVLPATPLYGSICGRIIDVDSGLFAGVTVKLIDTDNNQVGDPIVTGVDGAYAFLDLEIKPYTVMIVTPLGMTPTPSESIPGIEPGDPCHEVDFLLIPTIVENDCRGLGYWKHQFDVYLTGKGHAQETATDLEAYLDAVYVHFDVLGVYMSLGEFDFEDAKDVLTVRGGKLTLDRAKQHLFTFLLNFASGRIGNATVISEDGRDAADAVTYIAQLIGDGDLTNDQLATNICDEINEGQMLEAGIIPESNIVYKLSPGGKLPNNFVLSQNYPNPFNPSTRISFEIPKNGEVSLRVFDLTGREVATLVNENIATGSYEVEFNAEGLPSGVYFYRLKVGNFIETKKMVLMK